VNTIQLAYWNTYRLSDIRHRRSRDVESSSTILSVYRSANEEHKWRRISVWPTIVSFSQCNKVKQYELCEGCFDQSPVMG